MESTSIDSRNRTIENDRDRKMTIMTTTFIPCGAKLPIIALIGNVIAFLFVLLFIYLLFRPYKESHTLDICYR